MGISYENKIFLASESFFYRWVSFLVCKTFGSFVDIVCLLCIALRIHISEVTKRILEALGGFIVETRGEVFLKVRIVI